MPTHRRVKSKDEELGKRDDDMRPRTSADSPSSVLRPWRWRKRRMLAVLAGIAFLYVFIRNIPTDLGPVDRRYGMQLRPGQVFHDTQELREPGGPAPRTAGDGKEGRFYYEGPIKYYRLASSLNRIARTMGSRPTNRNVLFATSSLKSVANLMPMACQMARWNRNYVHLAVLGRDPLLLEHILEINGVGKQSCPVYFHDARSDYSESSSAKRAEVAVLGAMKHINDFMHPQAIIMDDANLEDEFFTRAMRKRAKDLRRTLIEVPDGKYEDFLWMTRLDSASLANWHRLTIDILIHAPPRSSGGLIRLVRSLEQADYSGLKAPRLTIELPSDVEPFARSYLETLEWPTDKTASSLGTSALALHHRIPSSRVTPDQASLRFLESFYPTSTEDNHVLILSPQVELSRLYLQYVYYAALEYKYAASSSRNTEDLLGLSLDIPTTFINGSRDFIQPKVADMNSKKYTESEKLDQSAASAFLYEAPSATASLIFGDKWATLHHFLSNRLAAIHAGKAEKRKKLVSETEPSWLEYLLELMRARGWSMLHPASSFVTVHNELVHVPEEYMRDGSDMTKTAEGNEPAESLDEEAFLTAPDPRVIEPLTEKDSPDSFLPLQETLPFDGHLPLLQTLPYVYHTGDLIRSDSATEYKDNYISHFRRHIGGCEGTDADRKRINRYLKTDDLFCLPGMEPEYDDESKDDDDDDDNDDEEGEAAEATVKETEPPAEESKDAESDAKAEGGDDEAVKATVETKEEVKAQEEGGLG